MQLYTCIGVILVSLLTICTGKIWEIPIPTTLQECYNQVQHADIETFVGSTFSWFCETAIKKSQLQGPKQFDSQKLGYYQQLYDKSIEFVPQLKRSNGRRGNFRGKRQAGAPRCLRREYRMMTDEERRRFHAAVNTLKQDTTVEPNKYDAIALLHTGMAAFTAHGGAGFPGWHRIYILMFETALREVDASVCLPYWDSTLDAELDDPTLSPLWTSEFFGTSQGPVVEGPFANWVTPEGVQLMRNVGSDGDPFTSSAVEDILSRVRHQDILTSSETEPRFDLEFHHAAVHVFCGGTMGQLDTAAFDPIFFLHHSFVDYLWELFRTNLRSLGVDPQVYPDIADMDSRHHSTASTGFGNMTQLDGYSDLITETYEYEAAPICTSRFPECGSSFLTCFAEIGRCVPIIPDIPSPLPQPLPNPPKPNPKPNPIPPIDPTFPNNGACSKQGNSYKQYGMPVQNDFCCDQSCDTNEWATIPVKVVSVRPPKYSKYSSFPVKNGRVDSKNDIYSPSAYAQTSRWISRRQGNPKTYKRCRDDESVGQVFLSSKGINYDGYYKEAAIVDNRLAVSISMGFISVKKPTRGKMGVTKALLRAHDSCGRVCHAACKDPVSGEYKDCSGAVAISNQAPRMFGVTYDDAVMSVFDYEFNNDCPSFKTENFFMTFYCDYHNEFPYAEHSHGPAPAPIKKVPPPRPVPVVVPRSQTGCQVTSQCVLDVPCESEFRQCSLYNEKHVCHHSCRAFGVCTYGRYFLRLCPDGQYFDDQLKECVIGNCRKIPGQPRVIDGHDGHGHGHSHSPSNFPSRSSSSSTRRGRGYNEASQSRRHQNSRNQSSRRPTSQSQTNRPYFSSLLTGFMRNIGK